MRKQQQVQLEIVGQSVTRKDARGKVTGQTRFIDDYSRTDLLHAATVRSTVPRCKITKYDTRAARQVPGFVAFYTAKDIPGKNAVPFILTDMPFLTDEPQFAGQAIALVVATSRAAAKKAAALVEVKFTTLPPLLDPLLALKKGARKIFGKDNIFREYVTRKGNADAALKKADIVIARTYTTGYQVHCYLETQGMLAEPELDGGIVIHGSLQCPYYVVNAVGYILGLPQSRIRVVQATTGGGFGGKEDMPSIVAGHAALCAWHLKRPVKIIYDREENFLAMSKRHPAHINITYGAKKNGMLTACKMRYILDGGAYSTLTPVVLGRGHMHAAGPYNIPNVFVESYGVATNKVPCGAFRGFGQPQVTFANESCIDELAVLLKMNPRTLRLKNRLKPGTKTMCGHTITGSCGLQDAINQTTAAAHWPEKWLRPEKKSGTVRYGLGMAASFYGVGLSSEGKVVERAAAHVQIMKDGAVQVAVGTTEMGQGMRTVLPQITAQALGAPLNQVELTETDTSRVPDSGPTVASRTTYMSGNAILQACALIRPRIDAVVRDLLKAPGRARVEAREGFYFIRNQPKKKIAYNEVLWQCYLRRVRLTEEGFYTVDNFTFDRATGLGKPYPAYTYSSMVAEVAVDTETGRVTVLNLISGHDIGKAVNPQLAEGQIQGGAAQGIGYALLENLVLRDGVILNPSLTNYIIPTTLDVPAKIHPVVLEHTHDAGPYGAKGLGEPPLVAAAAAIANAIYNATGIRLRSLPMLPENLCAAAGKE